MLPTPENHNFQALYVLTINDPKESPTIAVMGVFQSQPGAMHEAHSEANGALDWTIDIDTGILTAVDKRDRTFSVSMQVVMP